MRPAPAPRHFHPTASATEPNGIGGVLIGCIVLVGFGQPVATCVASGPGGPGEAPCGREAGWAGAPVAAVGAILLVAGLRVRRARRTTQGTW